MSSGDIVTPPVLERYELKYHIPESMIEPISSFISVYCTLDKYSQCEPDKFYQVNSLYLDTPSFLFLRNRLERATRRFNMRIRSYGVSPTPPYFLEIKQKTSSIIKKFRGTVMDHNVFSSYTTLVNYSPDYIDNEKELKNIRLFQLILQTYGAEPKVLTQYQRKAFVSDYEQYARVTFDKELKFMPESSYNLTPDPLRMIPYDLPQFFDPECNVILELKCYTSHVPLWMIDCIQAFQLEKRSFSKYVSSMSEVFGSFKSFSNSRECPRYNQVSQV